MTEIAPPAVARSGGVTSPHCGMVPRPAAPHPQPSGVLRDGTLCPPCATAPAGRKPGRGLSREAFTAIAEPILSRGGTMAEVAAATGMSWDACWARCNSYGLRRAKMDKFAEVARLYRLRWQPQEIAQRVGISVKSVYCYARIARRNGVEVPRAPFDGGFERQMNYAEVARRWNAGERQRDIAEAFGVRQTAVSSALHKMAASGMLTRPLGRWPRAGG